MLVRHTSNHNHCDWHVQKPLCQDFQVILNNSSWSKTTLCIVKEQIWLQNMKCYGKKLFWPERNAQNGFILHAYRLLDVQIPMTQVLRLHIQMFLSYGLYVYIIFDTAHHRATFGIFWNSTQNTTLKKISRKCSIFLHWLHFFLMGRSRMFFWIRIKFHLGRAKARGKSGVWGAKPKLRYLFAKFPLLSKIQTWSQRMLVRHTSNHNHCDWHVQKPLCQDFQVILNNSSWSKTTLCIVKEQIWLQNMKCYGKKLFWPERNAQNGFILHAYEVIGCADSNDTGFETVHSDVS